jgi:exodeoxyribonuclease-3
MRVISLNVNGIKRAAERGFFEWMAEQDADVVCVQDLQAKEYQLPDEMVNPDGYTGYFFDADEDGFSGVAVYCKEPPKAIMFGLGNPEFDIEGRFIQADFEGVSIASVLFPSGVAGTPLQDHKFQFMKAFMNHLKKTLRKRRDFLFCGTTYVAHKTHDVFDWKSQQGKSGFMDEERAWFDHILGPMGYVDCFREANFDQDEFTWWPDEQGAWERNEGWRIDYMLGTPGMKRSADMAKIYKNKRFSDHAPVIVDFDYELGESEEEFNFF